MTVATYAQSPFVNMPRAEAACYGREERLWIIPLVVGTVILTVLAEVMAWLNGFSAVEMMAFYAWKALKAVPLVICLMMAYHMVLGLRQGHQRPLLLLHQAFIQFWTQGYRTQSRVVPMMCMPFLFTSFSVLKMMIPLYIPFWLDETFADWDRVLFLGRQPWELTHSVLGATPTYIIDFLYSLWVILLSIATVGFAFFATRKLRARFFLSFAGAWILLGFVGAWLGSAAGPCYAAQVGIASAHEFDGLIKIMASHSIESQGIVDAYGWQQVLWNAYATKTFDVAMGISAMPSLHNAIAVLYALIAFRIGKAIGIFMSLYAAIIFVGSVHLGWHYAVDGIIAAVAMYAIWKAVDLYCQRSGYDRAVDAAAKASA